MSDFRTILPKENYPFSIQHRHSILSLGSCFAVHLAEHLKNRKFNVFSNPNGILFNPFSIAETLNLLLNQKSFTQDDLFFDGRLWHSYSHHSIYSGPEATGVLQEINTQLAAARKHLLDTDRIVLTFGTAFVWKQQSSGRIVANCHKQDHRQFVRSRLTVSEIVAVLQPLLDRLNDQLPELRYLISVSPVRHTRDGLIANQRSKATLILAAEELSRNFENVHYFPAYELLNDDLRDYRFYKRDMIHPSAQAVDYVWDYFTETLFTPQTREFVRRMEDILRAVQHQPFHPSAPAHQQFIQNYLHKIELLEQELPYLSFEKEKSILKRYKV